MLGPDYRRPAVTTPDAFRGASAAITPDQQSIAELKWFEVFQDEQLQELIRTALMQNYDLRDAVARVDAARANLGITQADQYPNFGIGADVTSSEQSRQGQFTIPRGTSRQRTFGTVFLNLFSFEIDIWGRLRRATEASRADLLGADWTRKAVITTLISDVATAYFSLLELDLELEIAKNTLATRAESLRLIRASTARRGRNASGRATGRATGLRRRGDDTGCRASNRANRKSNQFSARTQSRIDIAQSSANRSADAAGSAGRLAVEAVGKTPGYPGRGAKPGCGQRHHRCREGGLFPTDHADRRVRLSKHGAVESILRFKKNMEFHPSNYPADLRRRSDYLRCRAG